MKLLPLDFYRHHDVLLVARDLLGKVLMTNIDGQMTGGIIIETEAYRAPEDKASHAFGNRRTKRNAVMFARGGISYVYQCYGIHALFNIVTNEEDIAHAILIRAIEPLLGIETMLKRRHKNKVDKTLAGGPGTLTQALGINLKHNGVSLIENTIWIEDHGIVVPDKEVVVGPRVGVDYAGEDALLPWRFRWIKSKNAKIN
jgi:DNA-3-methyladenine glycosylase